jgi:hypothetical protein
MLDHGPVLSVPDGTNIRAGDVGKGGIGYLGKEGGTHWVGDVYGGWMDRKLDFNNLGYQQRANQWGGGVDAEYRTLTPAWATLETHTHFSGWQVRNDDDLLLSHGYQLFSYGKLTNFWRWFLSADAFLPHFDDREMGDGAALERAGRYGAEVGATTDTTKPVSLDFGSTWHAMSVGPRLEGYATVSLRVHPQLDLDVSPNWQIDLGEPRYVTTGATAGQYLFGHLDARSIGTTLRATYTFSPRLTLQAYTQLFLASGHYSGFLSYQSDPAGPRPTVRLGDLRPAPPPGSNPDFEQGALNVNVVLRWEWRLGSLLYVVYTRSQVPNVSLGAGEVGALDLGSVRRAPAADVFIVKLSYWWG